MRTPERQSPERILIRSKLEPPPPPDGLLSRPRLESLLAMLVGRHAVVVVSATAGAGKTTAVAAMAHRLEPQLAWLTVDRTDVAPGRLIAYLEAALALPAPHVAGVATDALAAGIPHPEAAGLLAEAVGDTPLVLVLDDLERLMDEREPWAVVEALMRYAPPTLRLVLVSRRELPATAFAFPPDAASLSEQDLAFTSDEASDALALLGEHDVDGEAVVQATSGWVTGVLFEAWRSDRHVAGLGGEADPLDGYLSTQILDQLDPELREFLVASSLLVEVSAPRAAALGLTRAGERLQALREAHIPVVWDVGALTMRWNPRFRDYLLKRLERGPAERVKELRAAHGRLLVAEGHYEEATEELLNVGALHEALPAAEQAIFTVIERLDFAIAERWLAELAKLPERDRSQLAVAELVLAIANDDYNRGVEVADRLAQLGERERLARSSDRAAALIAGHYLGKGRVDAAREVLATAGQGRATDAVRYVLGLYDLGPRPARPELSGGEMDGVIAYADYFYGRLAELAEAPVSRWAHAAVRPWYIAARAALGHTQEALAFYEGTQGVGFLPASFGVCVGPDVLIDAGRRDQARVAVAHAQDVARAGGARDLELFSVMMEAKLELRVERDPAAGQVVLERIEQDVARDGWPFVQGPWSAWFGLALLQQSRDERALEQLRRAVEIMVQADIVLELPTAAAYLSEAEWRAGEEEAADRAMDLALEASRRLGSNHRLLQALADFPALVARRIDAEPGVDTAWHELGRALIARDVPVAASVGASVELQEFGRPRLVVDGEQQRPRITKSFELLAFLIARDGDAADRDELLDALFDGRSDDSARSYLRQAIYWVRRTLPKDGLVLEGRRMRLGSELAITSESRRFESLVAEAAGMRGAEKRAAIAAALGLFDQGEYLDGGRSPWSEERRAQLTARATDLRYDAAELAFAAGDYTEAQELAGRALKDDQLREGTWRLMMRIANARGDDDGAIAAFRACERALAGIGASPSPSTRELLQHLRR